MSIVKPDPMCPPVSPELEGDLPRPKMKLVEAWVEIHRDELLADWQLAVEGQQPFNIEPLK
ncbi:MAG: DUF4160 domain-containing protein [Thermodesulfovibrionales bacterium]